MGTVKEVQALEIPRLAHGTSIGLKWAKIDLERLKKESPDSNYTFSIVIFRVLYNCIVFVYSNTRSSSEHSA